MVNCAMCKDTFLVPKASSTLKQSSDAEVTETATEYTKKKTLTTPAYTLAGTFTIKFSIHKDAGATSVEGRIYKNGVAHGTERTTTSLTYVEFTETLTFAAGDLVEMYVKVSGSGTVYLRNFRIYNDATCLSCGYDDSMLAKHTIT